MEDIITPAHLTTRLSPEQDAAEAMGLLARREVNQLPVVDDDDRLVGLLRREDVLKWLSLQQGGGAGGQAALASQAATRGSAGA